jgi:hypothetical protein
MLEAAHQRRRLRSQEGEERAAAKVTFLTLKNSRHRVLLMRL